jgi:hypothetical protein
MIAAFLANCKIEKKSQHPRPKDNSFSGKNLHDPAHDRLFSPQKHLRIIVYTPLQ